MILLTKLESDEVEKKLQKLRWDRIYCEAELYKTSVRLYTKLVFQWRKALSSSFDKITFYDFARKGLKNLDRIHKSLSSKQFRFRPGIALHHNFNGKKRTLYIFPWEERLVDLLIYRLLNNYFNRWFSPHSYAYRQPGWGIDCCQKKLSCFINKADSPIFIVKRDIADYFASIDHGILAGKLSALIERDDYLLQLIAERINFQYFDAGKLKTARMGIPFGTAVACFLANIYLTELDRKITSIPEVIYFRYADDILILSLNKKAALDASSICAEELHSLKLKSKSSHESDFVLSMQPVSDSCFKSSERFRHLGLQFQADGKTRLSLDKRRKICNLFRYAFRRRKSRLMKIEDHLKKAQFAVNIARRTLDNGVRNVAIIDYYLKHVQDEAQLVLLDRWLAEEVLFQTFGRGHSKGNFRKISFQKLRAMGLPSLVHRRRMILHRHIESSFFIWKNYQLIKESRGMAARFSGRSYDFSRELSLHAQKQQLEKPGEREGLPVDGCYRSQNR